jgi:hypothetical protein
MTVMGALPQIAIPGCYTASRLAETVHTSLTI